MLSHFNMSCSGKCLACNVLVRACQILCELDTNSVKSSCPVQSCPMLNVVCERYHAGVYTHAQLLQVLSRQTWLAIQLPT